MRSKHCAFAAVLLSVSAASAAFAAASLTPLGDLPGGAFKSSASGVSADGSVVVGGSTYSVYGYTQAFRWTSDGGMVGLGYPPGEPLVEPFSTATGVSGDGLVVVGAGSFDYRYSDEAFRWTSGGGMGGLGDLPMPFFREAAYGVSHNGSVVVGVIESDDSYEAFRWTSAGGR